MVLQEEEEEKKIWDLEITVGVFKTFYHICIVLFLKCRDKDNKHCDDNVVVAQTLLGFRDVSIVVSLTSAQYKSHDISLYALPPDTINKMTAFITCLFQSPTLIFGLSLVRPN